MRPLEPANRLWRGAGALRGAPARLALAAGLGLLLLGQHLALDPQSGPLAALAFGGGLALLTGLAWLADRLAAWAQSGPAPVGAEAASSEPGSPARPGRRPGRPWSRPRIWAVAGLAPILVLAAGLRFTGLDWDEGHHLHPDERFITMVATRVELPRNLAEYFDTARSPLNPYNRDFGSFIYGPFPLFGVRALAEALQAVARATPDPPPLLADLWPHLRDATGYGEVHRLGRVLSALAEVATVALVFCIGTRAGGPALGLLASLLSALAVLQIQSAHFWTAESPLVLVTTLAFFFALRAVQDRRWTDWIGLGVCCGLAVATKLTAGLLGVVVLAAVALVWRQARRESGTAAAEEALTALLTVGAVAFLTFRVAQPYAFSGPGFFDLAPNPKWLADLNTWQRIATGQLDYPPSHQWTGSTPYLWQLTNMTLWGLGPPLTLAAWAGFGLAVIRLLRPRSDSQLQLLGLLWVGVNFLYWGPQFTKPMRYLLPIYPQLALFAAFALLAVREVRLPWPRVPAPARSAPDLTLEAGQPPRLRPALPLFPLAVAMVVGWSAFYALAFTSIYTRPTTRVAASEWIYANVPAGSGIAWEHWDDPLPLRLPGRDSSAYRGIELPLYAEDTEEKRAQLVGKLDEADYIVLSSNRLYGSIPKLPQRYPMTIRYYQALFSGELGFDRVAEFTSRPALLGIELNDDDAEEIFTVYEHPKVTIFRKSPAYSSANTRAVLESVSLDHVLRGLRPVQARTGGLLLSESEQAAVRSGGTWSEIFDRESLPNRAPVLVWFLAVQALGWLAFPTVWWVCRGLADRGYVVAKTVGLLAIAYLPWLLASLHLFPYSRGSVLLAAAMLTGVSGAVVWRGWRELRAFWAANWRLLVGLEAVYAAGFLLFLGIRAANPDLWHPAYGGEKPMDFAYLNAVIRTTWFPPYDPWLAGGYINYYYFGFVIVASLIKLTGIVPWVAYNLAIPTVAALTAGSAAALVYSLLVGPRGATRERARWAFGGGMAGAGLLVIAGNLHAAVQAFEWLGRVGGGPVASLLPGVGGLVAAARGVAVLPALWLRGESIPPFQFDFWAPTRVITTEAVTPITEFPFFTFLYGDLHAHLIALPLTLLSLALALNLAHRPPAPLTGGDPGRAGIGAFHRWATRPEAVCLFAAGAVLGVLRMTNTWDYPTHLGVLVLGLVIGWRASRPRSDPSARASAPATGRRTELGLQPDAASVPPSSRGAGSAVWGATALGLLVLLALGTSPAVAAPFLARYEQFYVGLQPSPGHTSLAHYLTILGAFLAALAAWLGLRLRTSGAGLGRDVLHLMGAWASPPPAHAAVEAEAQAARPTAELDWRRLAAGLGALTASLALGLSGQPVVALVLALLAAIAAVVLARPLGVATRFALGLAGLALALTASVELVTLSGDIGRMNTVFKFYFQVWTLLAVAVAVLLTPMARWAWHRSRLPRLAAGAVGAGPSAANPADRFASSSGQPARASARAASLSPWGVGLALSLAGLLLAGLLYPLLGAPARLQHRFAPLGPSLDGLAFMAFARYVDNGQDLRLGDDFAAIRWLQDQVQGTPVILEGRAPLYHWGARVSIYTGLPTVLGWDWHQKQQRGDFAYLVDERAREVAELYGGASLEETLRLLRKHRVEYVYVGGLERAFYPPGGLEKFERMVGSSLDRVYSGGAVTIYRVRASG